MREEAVLDEGVICLSVNIKLHMDPGRPLQAEKVMIPVVLSWRLCNRTQQGIQQLEGKVETLESHISLSMDNSESNELSYTHIRIRCTY